MALDPKVFKAYDVRGLYPSELDEEGAYAIGRAYGEHFEPKRIAVGRDMRVSSPALAETTQPLPPPPTSSSTRTGTAGRIRKNLLESQIPNINSVTTPSRSNTAMSIPETWSYAETCNFGRSR